jgi:hypothetical protein
VGGGGRPGAAPLRGAGIVIGVWYALGVVLVIYFAPRHPQRTADTAKVFLDEGDAAGALPT